MHLKNIIIPLIIVGSVLAVISNVIVFRAYIQQQKNVGQMARIIPNITVDEALDGDMSYPNINIFTVPFKTLLGRVYLRDSLYDKAISTFHLAKKNNPYLLINENYLAETYLQIGEKDSLKYYAKKIFKNAPNHPNHFGLYIKSFDSLKYSFKIDSAFSKIKKRDSNIWKIYLATLYNVDSLYDRAKENIKVADSIFPKDKDIQNIIEAIKYGQAELKKSDELVRIADMLAKENNFKGSIKILKEALSLFKTSNSILDKLATSYYKLEEYDSSLHYLNMINLIKYQNPGRYHLIKGINLIKLDKIEEGCNEIFEAILLGNKEAVKANKSFCN